MAELLLHNQMVYTNCFWIYTKMSLGIKLFDTIYQLPQLKNSPNSLSNHFWSKLSAWCQDLGGRHRNYDTDKY